MKAVGLSPQIAVLLPVRQKRPHGIATLLTDHLGDELGGGHIHDVKRSEAGTPDRTVQAPVFHLWSHTQVRTDTQTHTQTHTHTQYNTLRL